MVGMRSWASRGKLAARGEYQGMSYSWWVAGDGEPTHMQGLWQVLPKPTLQAGPLIHGLDQPL
jgi:hypothetical protein